MKEKIEQFIGKEIPDEFWRTNGQDIVFELACLHLVAIENARGLREQIKRDIRRSLKPQPSGARVILSGKKPTPLKIVK